jgi:membrane fusion protein (multidrug efflux system)
VGQYLEPGTQITTLQGVDEAMHIDFAVTQDIAASAPAATRSEVGDRWPTTLPVRRASIVAVDARVDSATRNTWIRAPDCRSGQAVPQPGAAVRVRVPIGAVHDVLVVPVSALRRGPAGDHVYVVAPDDHGVPRAHMRRVKSGPMIGDDWC